MQKKKILRITTIAGTMNVILKGQLKYINESFDVIGATAPFYNYFDEIEEREGVKLYKIKFTRRITPFLDLIALFSLVRVILKEKPDIIHAQTPKANLIGMLAGYICFTKVRMLSIVGMPAYEEIGLKGRLLRFIDVLGFKMATHIYPNSKGLYEHYREWPSVKNKIGLIGNGSSNGIDFDYYNPSSVSQELLKQLRLELGLESNHFVFSFMGRVVCDKGLKELIDAFLSFCDSSDYKNSRLLIIGPMRETDDPLPAKYKGIISTHPKILHVGLQSDVRPYLLLSNVFVFPSHREGLPGSLMQAGALELPLIASDIVGNQEIINQTNGLLFPARDVEKLAFIMKEVYLDTRKLLLMKEKLRERMSYLYNQKCFWNSLREEYVKILGN